MLVLSRRVEEKVILPTVPAIFKVISIQSGQVRLGIEAPLHVPVLREELTRSEHAKLPVIHHDHIGDLSPVDHVHNLMFALTLLRVQLKECSPTVQKTLEGFEEELRGLSVSLALVAV